MLPVVKTLSRHLIVELYGCDRDALNDPALAREAMMEAAAAVGATPMADCFHRYAPQGVSGAVIIAESHLSIHTWPEHGYAAVDIFTCGDLDPRPGVAVLRRALGAREERVQVILRGVPGEIAGHDLRPDEVRITAR